MANRTTGLAPYNGLKFVKTLHGGPPAMDQIPLVSDAYYPGQVLRVSGTSGSGAVAAAAGTSMAYVAASYVATTDSTVGKHPVYRLDDFNIFEAKMAVSSTPQQKVGDLCDLAVKGENHALQGTASTKVLQIVGFPGQESTDAATNHNYYVKAARSLWASTKSDVTK